MSRQTLIDFFEDFARIDGEFLVHDDGYRSRTHSYAEVAGASRAFAARLDAAGVRKGDKVVLWAENRPEWVVALWGCLLIGGIIVPIDYRSPIEFVTRVRKIVGARIVLVGDDVSLEDRGSGVGGRGSGVGGRGSGIGDRGSGIGDGAVLEPALDGAAAWRLSSIDWHDRRQPPAVSASRDDVAEIIFTSGATAEPKGVVITHRNILANVVPIETEVAKYRKYGRPFFPLRFLNLLPLSHMFGQAMATFIPPMLPGTTVFMRSYNPHDIIRQIKQRRVSVLVSVPKILDVLREHLVRLDPTTAQPLPRPLHVARRWWKYRAIHRQVGLKFWAFVVGAAPLDRELEEFWSRLGFVVVQGYGLTETAPIVSLNHPFAAQKGSVGKPIAGVEMKIAPDGEILVRGENVTSGYYNAPSETADAFEDGWLRTGDIGAVDADGRLFVRGRKKEMIVTPEGLNVFPEDVERVVNEITGVRESAVVGLAQGGEERVHVVLVVEPGTNPDEVIRQANARLADHQRIRGASVWPGADLPRTAGTRKLKRRDVKQWAESGRPPQAASPADSLEGVLAKFTRGRDVAPGTTIDELGLSSLERIELMVALEDAYHTTVDEAAFSQAKDVGELRGLLESSAPKPPEGGDALVFPAWNRSWPIRLVRRLSLPTWILPLARIFARMRVEGRHHLDAVQGPVIFAANHQSHMDAPVILLALPANRRYRVAPAMAKEFFKPHFFPRQHSRGAWLTNSLNYYLAAAFFNAFPLPQREAGARQTLRYIGEMLGEGFSILIFPEGARTEAGEIATFRPGVGMIAARLGVPVVPVRLEGLDRVLHHSWRMARPGRVRVAFGAPMTFTGEHYEAYAREVEAAVRAL